MFTTLRRPAARVPGVTARLSRILAAVAIGTVVLGMGFVSEAEGDNAGQLGGWGQYGTEPGQFRFPSILGVEPDGGVFVGDSPEGYESFRIQKLSATGHLEGSVTIPTPNEEVFQGIAVDPEKGRFYVLRDQEFSDPETGEARAETILAFSTTPDESGTLVPPTDGPPELPVPEGSDSIDNPTELVLDPQNAELEIAGVAQGGEPVIQRIRTDGEGAIGPRYQQPAGSDQLQSDFAIAVGPDGTTYIAEYEDAHDPVDLRLFTLPQDLAGAPEEVPGFVGRFPEIKHATKGTFSFGSQIAVSPDGETLYLKQVAAPYQHSDFTPGEFEILGVSLRDFSTRALFGPGTVELQCDIQSFSAALAASDDGIFVLDQGPSSEGAPAYGDHVLHFGAGGSGCPAPTAAAALRTPAGEVSSVPPGTSVTFDGTGSELGQWGEGFEAATWTVEGPDGESEETAPNDLTLEHTFGAPGDYTIRLVVKVKLDREAPGRTAALFSAAPQRFTVADGPVVTRTSISGLAPAAGPEEGGNTVTIFGSGFEGVTSVKFGDAMATDFVDVDANTITATAPPGTAGESVDVSVSTAAGNSRRVAVDRYTYEGPVVVGPSVSTLGPAFGPAAGGNLVTITGTELDAATAVKFGSVAATEVTPVDSTTVTARAPRGAPGTVVDVVVETPAGPTALRAGDRYKYEALSQELGVVKAGSGVGTVASNRAGISCGTSCSAAFPQAATVVLLASPAVGSTFGGWGGACSGQGPCVVGMTSAKSVTATFEAKDSPAAGKAAGAAQVKKSSSEQSSKAPKCKPGTRLKKFSKGTRCVKKKPGPRKARHERRRKHKKPAQRDQRRSHAR